MNEQFYPNLAWCASLGDISTNIVKRKIHFRKHIDRLDLLWQPQKGKAKRRRISGQGA